MSLKAKLEAVIYAAEEPVTLAQLALLFTADALEWKAEQDAAAAAASAAEAEKAAANAEPLPLIAGDFAGPEDGEDAQEATGEAVPEGAAENVAEAAGVVEMEPGAGGGAIAAEVMTESTLEPGQGAEGDGGRELASGEPEAPAESAESALKREARQRDRDVRNVLRSLLDELIDDYATDDRGIEIREVAGGYRMATKPECHDAVRGFVKSLKPPLKLSLPALETLAVIAYKQPVTAPEVNEIRGVDSSGVFGSLLSRKLIATAGRKQVVGRPILYKTTREFLLRFGLKDVSELPSMEEFEKLAASELEEPETDATAEPGAEGSAEQVPEFDESASEEPEAKGGASNTTEPAAGAQDGAEGAAAAESGAEASAPASEAIEPAAETAEPAAETAEPAAEAAEPAADEPAETEQIPHD